MNKEKTLLLIETNPKTDIFFNSWLNNGFDAKVIFKKVPKVLRAVRRIWLKNNSPLSFIWYNNWYNNLSNYEAIIIHMSKLTRYMPFIISNKYPKIRIICWYWNTIDKDTIPIKTNNPLINYYSFDKNDCKKYSINYNNQYYCMDKNINSNNISSDIYFIGRSKGRDAIINNIRKEAEKNNIKCNFKIIADNSNDIIPYNSVKNDIMNTKAILEINKNDQIGLTLRALESLFFEKKLITNNKTIIDEPFYNKDNIFIIGLDDLKNLHYFINSDYNKDVNKYKLQYDIETWFNNFDL